MKKTLLATALLAGFVSAASAQSSVTLYGVIDAAIGYTNYAYSNSTTGSVGNSQFGALTSQQSGSRWGMKGVEDLGGGAKVIFQLESGFNPSNGTGNSSRLFNRASWFGVQGANWGTVKFGRQNSTAYDYQGLNADPFEIANAIVGSTTSFTWNSNRYDNMLSYETPAMSGFQAKVGYSFATGLTTSYQATTAAGANTFSSTQSAGLAYNFNTQNNTTAAMIGAKYTNGPLFLVATYDQVMPNQNIVSGLSNINAFILGGSYDFGAVKVFADYGRQTNGLLAGGNQQMQGANSSFTGSASADITDASSVTNSNTVFVQGATVNAYLLGLSAPVGANGTLLASWQMANPNSTFSQNAYLVSAANQNTYSIGYSYAFSKRTNLYAFGAYSNNYAMISGLNATQVMVGMRHAF